MKRRIVLLGPPASGKGTQAEMIHSRYDLPIASPGAMFREEKRLGTLRGQEADQLTSQGRLVPDGMVNGLVEEWVTDHQDGFVFDGYPRSFGQAEALESMLHKRAGALDVVLSLEVDPLTIRDRVERRWMCSSCGRIVSMGLHVSSSDADCPSCAGSLVKRSDDSPETLALRMTEYAAKTEPLISYYSERGILRGVDAARSPKLVFETVAHILEER